MARQEPTQVNGRQKRKNAKPKHLLLAQILEFDAVQGLIADLEAARWTGRKGYPIRVKFAALLAQYVYVIPTITGLVRSLKDNPKLQEACGIRSPRQTPSEDALYRFRKKLLDNPVLAEAIRKVVNTLPLLLADFGHQVAIDATDIEAWCNTARKELRDRDAEWGMRNFRTEPGGKRKMDPYYGFKLHLIVDANYELPIGWSVTPSNVNDCTQAIPVFEQAEEAHNWFAPEHFMADKGYDSTEIHKTLEGRYDCHPVIPLKEMKQEAPVLDKKGRPFCDFGTFKWQGSDYKRKRSRWHCPVKCGQMARVGGHLGCCSQNGLTEYLRWEDEPRKHSLIPRGTPKFKKLYNKRGSVEREFSRLKDRFLLDTLRVQGIEKVRLHVELSIFVRLLTALTDLSPP